MSQSCQAERLSQQAQQQAQAASAFSEELSLRHEQALHELQEGQVQLQQARAHEAALTGQLAAATAQEDQRKQDDVLALDELRAQFEQAKLAQQNSKQQLEQAENAATALREHLASAQQETAEALRQVQDATAASQQHEAQLQQASSDITNSRQLLKQARDIELDLQQRLVSDGGDRQLAQQAAEEAAEKLQTQLDKTLLELQDSRQQLVQASEAEANLQACLAAAGTDKEQAQQQTADSRHSFDRCRADLEAKSAECSDVAEQLRQAQERIASHTLQAAHSQSKVSDALRIFKTSLWMKPFPSLSLSEATMLFISHS